jgi:dsDNA-specific endonuclease/ATPase MutS2
MEQHDRNRQQAMAELEQIRQEGLRVQREGQAEAERLHNDALQFRQQTQQQCDQLMARNRQEANAISEGANRYAEQVLGELESRLKEMGQVVMAGRQELVKLQVVDNSPATSPAPQASGTRPVSKRRKMAEALRRHAS